MMSVGVQCTYTIVFYANSPSGFSTCAYVRILYGLVMHTEFLHLHWRISVLLHQTMHVYVLSVVSSRFNVSYVCLNTALNYLFVVALFAVRTDCKQGTNLEEPWATTHFPPVYYSRTLKG